MKNVKMFMFKSCPHCKKALNYMDELKLEHPEYSKLNIEIIDEKLNPEIADTYDYYYVPSYFVDGEKVHEGTITKEAVQEVFNKSIK